MTIQELFEWANENDALNEPVSIPDNYGGVEPKIYGQYVVEKNMKKRGGVRRKKRG